MDEELTFGQWLRRSRKARDLTQTELARQISCALGTIRKLEADELRPSKELAARLAAHFDVPETERAAFVAYARGQADSPLPPARKNVASAVPPAIPRIRAYNLPIQLTSFIGRSHELMTLAAMLAEARLLTLTGPGGSGKTRLALELASAVLEQFPDGIWLVELVPLADPALIVPAIAAVLQVREDSERPLLIALISYLRDKDVLLFLDNCEHLIDACAEVASTLLQPTGVRRDGGERCAAGPSVRAPGRHPAGDRTGGGAHAPVAAGPDCSAA